EGQHRGATGGRQGLRLSRQLLRCLSLHELEGGGVGPRRPDGPEHQRRQQPADPRHRRRLVSALAEPSAARRCRLADVPGRHAGTVAFGASDAPMTDSAIAAIGGNVLHIPTVLGAVVVAYNLPGLAQPVKFTPDVIADIFLGKITKWNDARLTSINAGLSLPATDIVVVHRADGSGTSFVFTDYLSKVSSEWQQKVGKG